MTKQDVPLMLQRQIISDWIALTEKNRRKRMAELGRSKSPRKAEAARANLAGVNKRRTDQLNRRIRTAIRAVQAGKCSATTAAQKIARCNYKRFKSALDAAEAGFE